MGKDKLASFPSSGFLPETTKESRLSFSQGCVATPVLYPERMSSKIRGGSILIEAEHVLRAL